MDYTTGQDHDQDVFRAAFGLQGAVEELEAESRERGDDGDQGEPVISTIRYTVIRRC